jgi:branched-chain amino acid transport system substrate-binding protein
MTQAITRRAAASVLASGLASGRFPLNRPARAAEPPKDPPVFRIGALLGLGDKANWNATVMQRGILMAVDEINAAGGIDGIKVEAAIEDHQGVPRVGVDALQRLRARYDIQAVLLSYSVVALATAPICEEQKIFMLDGGSVTDGLVGKFSYLYHNRSVASVLARAALTIAKEKGFKKMAVMCASTDDGQSLLRVSQADWKAHGGEIVAVEQALATASNVDTQIAKLRTSDADFLAIWEFSPGPGLVLKRAREFGMKQPIIGVEFTAEIAKVAGQNADGFQYASDYFNPNAGDPWPKRFADAYQKKYGDPPEVYAANYYEGIYVIAELIRRAREGGGDYFKGERLLEAVRAKPRVPSVYGGDMVFQPDGTCLKRVGIFSVKEAKGSFEHFAELAK